MPTLLMCCLLLLTWWLPAHAATINLSWNASPGASTYKLYYGTQDGPPYQTVLDTGPATTASVDGLIDGTRYYFAATALNAVGESGFSNEVAAVAGIPPAVLAVNAGGPQFTAADGTVYDADRWFTGGATSSVTANIAGPSDQTLYLSERHGIDFSYNLPVQNGTYLVTLKFAEITWDKRNRRVFDVLISGKPVINNLDLYREVGKNRQYDRTFTAQVTNSLLTIGFHADRDHATVAAIKVAPQ